MHFLLASLKVVYVLTTQRPTQGGEEETVEQTRARLKWEQDDYICKGHVCNSMSDALFDVYQNFNTAKELWDALETKYLTQDATSKKFLVGRFINFKMLDGRPIMEQFHEIMHLLSQIAQNNMHMDESISVSTIIEKLPPSWKDVKKNLKHKKDDMTLEQLGQHLQVEEVFRHNQSGAEEHASKVHMMEEGQSSKQGKPKKDNKKRKASFDKGNNKKKPKGACFHCGKPGHYKAQCRFLKKKQEESSTNNDFVAMISEVNAIEDDTNWWIDSGATRHVCKDKSMFTKYVPMEDGKVIFMGNSSTAEVKGKGEVKLVFTKGKL